MSPERLFSVTAFFSFPSPYPHRFFPRPRPLSFCWCWEAFVSLQELPSPGLFTINTFVNSLVTESPLNPCGRFAWGREGAVILKLGKKMKFLWQGTRLCSWWWTSGAGEVMQHHRGRGRCPRGPHSGRHGSVLGTDLGQQAAGAALWVIAARSWALRGTYFTYCRFSETLEMVSPLSL